MVRERGEQAWRLWPVSDYHADRAAEDGASVAAGAGGEEDRPLFGVRHRCPLAADGHLRAHRALAGLHMVSHNQSTLFNSSVVI